MAKFIIVGAQCSGKQEVIDSLQQDHGDIKIGKLFTNLQKQKNIYHNLNNFEVYTENDIHDIFENKAYLFLKEMEELSYEFYEGLSLYSFEHNDVFVLTPDQFINIPLIDWKEDICIIWLDNTKSDRLNRYHADNRKYNFQTRENIEKNYMADLVKNIYDFPNAKVIYFTNEIPQRIAAILYALYKDNSLINEFSKKFN